MAVISPKRVTVQDVAREAGVALATVSAALHDTGRVGPQQRKRIRDIAERLGYQPKLAARMLRAHRTKRLGLLVTDIGAPTGIAELGSTGPILTAFIARCEQVGLGYHVEFLGNRLCEKEFAGPEIFLGRMVDAAVAVGYLGKSPAASWFEENQVGYPTVSVGEPSEYAVLSDDQLGVHRAVEHLVALGHKRVAYVGKISPYWTHEQGAAGFARAAEEFRLDTDEGNWIRSRPHSHDRRQDIDAGLVQARELLSTSRRPSAVICSSIPAARCIHHVARDFGIRVPEELSLIAYGTASDAEKGPPLLTSIEPAHQAIVNSAVELLSRRLEAKEAIEQKVILVPPHFVERQSVAPPGR